MLKRYNLYRILFYLLIFVCVFTSNDWKFHPDDAQGEILRFDNILLLGQANIFHLFAGIFFLILFLEKLIL